MLLVVPTSPVVAQQEASDQGFELIVVADGQGFYDANLHNVIKEAIRVWIVEISEYPSRHGVVVQIRNDGSTRVLCWVRAESTQGSIPEPCLTEEEQPTRELRFLSFQGYDRRLLAGFNTVALDFLHRSVRSIHFIGSGAPEEFFPADVGGILQAMYIRHIPVNLYLKAGQCDRWREALWIEVSGLAWSCTVLEDIRDEEVTISRVARGARRLANLLLL